MAHAPDIDSAVLAEVEKALTKLGSSSVLIYRASAMSPAALYEEMEKLCAAEAAWRHRRVGRHTYR